jgi:hypothetical protein
MVDGSVVIWITRVRGYFKTRTGSLLCKGKQP